MTDDLLRELQRIQRYAAGLQGLIADAETKSPQRAEGADRSGVVRVVLGPSGIPKSYQVEQNWERKLKPEAFGDAVVEAFQTAMGARLSAWTTSLRDEGWQAKVDSLDGDIDKQPTQSEIPEMFRGPAFAGKPRDLGELTEDMIKAFDDIEKTPVAPPVAKNAVGTSAGGKLVLTLSKSGVVSCVADPKWVSAQTGTRLMNALGEALAAAKTQLEKISDTQEPARPLDRLLGETFALLNDPERLAES